MAEKDIAAAKIQKGKENVNENEGGDLLNVPEVDYLDISETTSEVDENFEDERKEEALAAALLSQRENALLEPDD